MKKLYFTKEARIQIKSEIADSSFNEVFFVGSLGADRLVSDVAVLARGNKFSVPAIIDAASTGQVVIHNHPSGNLSPSDQDIGIASVFGNKGVGFYIVDNEVQNTYVVVEPHIKKAEIPLDLDEAKELLLPDGGISNQLKQKYEYREEQVKALETVVNAYNQQNISIIEAGTGTGKTLSYLIPAVKWAVQNEERVLVSTNTINLQEQLINKDIPMLKNALGTDFKYSLIKGMRNYLCVMRVEGLKEGYFDFVDDTDQESLNSIIDWSKSTTDGSLSDLSFSPPPEVWEKVSAESESCLRARCPHYSECFFYKSRREIADSQLLVANHHLLFSDLAIKEVGSETEVGIIPPYRRVIFDEAHNIVDSATSHFSMRLTKFGLIRILRRLRSNNRNKKLMGLIYYASSLAEKANDKLIMEILERAEKVFIPILEKIEFENETAFDSLYNFGLYIFNEPLHNKSEINIRLTSKIYNNEEWGEIHEKFIILRNSLVRLYEEIRYFLELIEMNEYGNAFIKLVAEFGGVNSKIYYYSNVIDTFLDKTDDSFVRWFEGRMGRGGILSGIGLSPLDVSNELKEKLYSKAKTIVMTSATLSVNKNFEFQKYHLGLTDNERTDELIVSSPFDFKSQSLLLVPDDIPEPNNRDYEDSISEIIFDSIHISKGNALVLFTSYGSLNRVYEKVKETVDKNGLGLEILKQGDLPRAKLLEKFILINNSVLFATDSFWEGIDVPGDSLKLVIICRLPFKVPTDPVNEARIEHLESKGINPFFEYTVPLAILKFKQGFGRLIRTKNDKGVVMVLDRRIVSKTYGRLFIESLPDCGFYKSSSIKVLDKLTQFLK